jgi:hypothetical protein
VDKRFFEQVEWWGDEPRGAQALAMLGVVAAHPLLGLERIRPGEELDLSDLAKGRLIRFGFSSQDREPLERLFASWLRYVDQLAASWTALVEKIGPPRIEIAHENESPEVLAYFAEVLSREAVRAAAVHVRTLAPRVEKPFEWPLEIVARDYELRSIAALLDEMADGAELVRFSRLRDEEVSHVLVVPPRVGFVPGAPGPAVWELPASAMAFAFVPEKTAAEGAMALGLRLRYALKTNAVLVVPIATSMRVDFLLTLFGELRRRRRIDEAVLISGRGRPAPFLLSSEEFLAETNLPAREVPDALSEVRELVGSLQARSEGAEIPLPEELARLLNLERAEVSAPELGNALQELLVASPDEAETIYPRLRHAVRKADQLIEKASPARPDVLASTEPKEKKPQLRYLQANIFSVEEEDRKPALEPGALLAGHPYLVEVHIGPVRPSSRYVWSPLSEKLLPPSTESEEHLLTVVFSIISGGRPTPQSARIHLGPEGDSSRCSFELVAPPRESLKPSNGRLLARITTLYQNRVLQTAILSAPVVASPDERTKIERGVEQEVELPPIASLESRVARKPFDATLILNHDATGQAGAMVVEEGKARWINIDQPDLEMTANQMRAQLNKLTQSDDRPESPSDERFRKVLIALANQGTLLWRDVILGGEVGPGLRHGKRLHILEARRGTFLPVELFYEFEAPRTDAQLCPNAQQALESGECHHACHQDEEVAEDYVCPAGFWGITRVLERQRVPDTADARGDVGLRSAPVESPGNIPIVRQGLVGISHRVDNHVQGSTQILRNAIHALWPSRMRDVTGWREWAREVQGRAPSLLVMLVHTDKDQDTDVATIEIAHEAIAVSNLQERHIRSKGSQEGVLVVLLGCSPVLPMVKFQSVVSQFLLLGDRRRTVVVSSIADMLGRHAVPTTAALLERLNHLVSEGPVDVGEAILRLRRELLLGGDPLMLSLVVYGDVDWMLVDAASATEGMDVEAGNAAGGMRRLPAPGLPP